MILKIGQFGNGSFHLWRYVEDFDELKIIPFYDRSAKIEMSKDLDEYCVWLDGKPINPDMIMFSFDNIGQDEVYLNYIHFLNKKPESMKYGLP